MATLIVQSSAEAGKRIELPFGTHRVGRSEDNDVSMPETSVSTHHCELAVSEIGIAVRDLGSTNGTYINGERITHGMLQTNDILRLGDVELRAELPEVTIAIPQTGLPEAPGAAFLEDGTPACFNHREIAATIRCTKCENWWCGDCVRRLKRVSGDYLNFCPECSAACVSLPGNTGRQGMGLLRRIASAFRRPK